MDYLAIGIHELANISERRMEKLTNPGKKVLCHQSCNLLFVPPSMHYILCVHADTNYGLPAFLINQEEGVNSGFMIAQYTAAALGKPQQFRSPYMSASKLTFVISLHTCSVREQGADTSFLS